LKHIIREVYSEVLFELAEETGTAEDVLADIEAVSEVFRREPAFAMLLNSESIKPAEKSEIIKRIFKGKVSDLTLHFLSVLARR